MSTHDDMLKAPRVETDHVENKRAPQPTHAPADMQSMADASVHPTQGHKRTTIAAAIGYTALAFFGVVLGLLLGLLFVEATGLWHFTLC